MSTPVITNVASQHLADSLKTYVRRPQAKWMMYARGPAGPAGGYNMPTQSVTAKSERFLWEITRNYTDPTDFADANGPFGYNSGTDTWAFNHQAATDWKAVIDDLLDDTVNPDPLYIGPISMTHFACERATFEGWRVYIAGIANNGGKARITTLANHGISSGATTAQRTCTVGFTGVASYNTTHVLTRFSDTVVDSDIDFDSVVTNRGMLIRPHLLTWRVYPPNIVFERLGDMESTATNSGNIASIVNNGAAQIRLTVTGGTHPFVVGFMKSVVKLAGTGNSSYDGKRYRVITNVDADTVDLDGPYDGDVTSTGTWTEPSGILAISSFAKGSTHPTSDYTLNLDNATVRDVLSDVYSKRFLAYKGYIPRINMLGGGEFTHAETGGASVTYDWSNICDMFGQTYQKIRDGGGGGPMLSGGTVAMNFRQTDTQNNTDVDAALANHFTVWESEGLHQKTNVGLGYAETQMKAVRRYVQGGGIFCNLPRTQSPGGAFDTSDFNRQIGISSIATRTGDPYGTGSTFTIRVVTNRLHYLEDTDRKMVAFRDVVAALEGNQYVAVVIDGTTFDVPLAPHQADYEVVSTSVVEMIRSDYDYMAMFHMMCRGDGSGTLADDLTGIWLNPFDSGFSTYHVNEYPNPVFPDWEATYGWRNGDWTIGVSAATTAVASDGGFCQFTSADHRLPVHQLVTITDGAHNGVHEVTAVTTNTFTTDQSFSSNVTGTWAADINGSGDYWWEFGDTGVTFDGPTEIRCGFRNAAGSFFTGHLWPQNRRAWFTSGLWTPAS